MKNVSTAFKNCIQTGGPFYAYADATLSTGEKLTLTSDHDFMIDGNTFAEQGGSNGFPLGEAISKTITLTIDNADERFSKYDFYYARIVLHTEVDIPDAGIGKPSVERVSEGVFTVLNPVAVDDVIELTAYDDMWKADRSFASKLAYPVTARQLLVEVCESCDILLGSAAFLNQDFQILHAPEKLTGRQVIGYIAQIACGNAVIQNGTLVIKSYDFSAFSGITDDTTPAELEENDGYHIFENYNTSPDIDTDNVVITGVSTTRGSGDEEETILYGKDAYCIKIDNPLIEDVEESAIDLIGKNLVGVTLRKFSGEFFPDPSVEFMDLACVIDKKDHVYRSLITTHEFTYLGGSSYSCDINSPDRQAGAYYSNATGIYQNQKELSKNKKEWEKAVEHLNETLVNASGMYPTEVKQEDGSTILYVHDKKTLEESKNVFKITSDAVGFSTDGGKTYPFGFTLTGDFIARILYAIGINADYINTGTFTVKDAEGNITFQADTQTGKVIINGNSVIIGGKTATEAIDSANAAANNALTAALNARNMTMQLSNDYYSVNVDSGGKYSEFPSDVTTIAQVMYGTQDVTSDCTFIVTESGGITGSWNNAKHQYTVTGLSVDTGWVDIQATYLSKLVVTKRFTIAKLYAGADGIDGTPGIPGRTYFIELSSKVLKRSKDNTISPNFFTIKGFYRDGDSATRTAYNGRFTIEETTDGNTWKNVYTSESDESSVTHSLYTAIATGSGTGQVIGDADGNAIGFPRDVIAVRCTLYAAGGTTTALDVQDAAILVDVDALTQEEIFNALTNNGEVKGIYKEGNQLYISFTYAKGGTLTLGGKGNGNGLLKIFDDKNVITAMMNNEGLCFGYFLDSSEGKTELPSFESGVAKMLIKNGILQSEDPHFYGTVYLNKVGNEKYKYHEDYPMFRDTSLTTGRASLLVGVDKSNKTDYEKFGILKTFSVSAEEVYIKAFEESNSNGYVRITGKTDISGSLNCSSISGGSANFSGTLETYQLNTTGSKKRVVQTEEYGRRSLYCYEMPTPMFGDIGEAITDEYGLCYVYIDDIFEKTVNTDIEYQVFLQKEGEGDIWIEKKEKAYFVVKGTKNLKFSWELKIKQKDFELERLELSNPNEKEFEDVDYETQGQKNFEEYLRRAEEL